MIVYNFRGIMDPWIRFINTLQIIQLAAVIIVSDFEKALLLVATECNHPPLYSLFFFILIIMVISIYFQQISLLFCYIIISVDPQLYPVFTVLIVYLIYIVIKFHLMLVDTVKNSINNQSVRGIIPSVVSNADNSSLQDEYSNRLLCVICLERERCIVTQPCKHLSMCISCNNEIRRSQSSCPICKQFIWNYEQIIVC